MKTIAVIPARYGSTRFPAKPLALIAGKPMIQWTYESTCKCNDFAEVLVATDDERIREAVVAFGGQAVMTSESCRSGTDRIWEAIQGRDADLIVNVQGDEPLIPASVLHQLVLQMKSSGADMGTVASHANSVIAAIRKYSDNLVLVGSPEWSSHPEQCAQAGIQDSKKNFGCTLHFYAATHQTGNGGYNDRAAQAMSAGVPVFATEWGTVSADGNGSPNQSASQAWISWMNQNNVSWANWSASAIKEQSAAFQNLAIDNGLTFTTSGNMVKGWMNGASGYKDCGLQNGSSSGNSGFSTGVANGAKTDIIDDLEDGDRFAYSGGWWSAFADSDDDTDGKGETSISNSKWENDFGKQVYDVLMPKKGDKNTSKYMAGIEKIKLAKGAYKYAPYVAIGLNLKRDTTIIDLSACKSIS